MKFLPCFLFFVAIATASDNVATIPEMPDDVTLASGRVLHKVNVVRWEKDRVVLKYAGGADPIAFSLIKSVPLAELVAMRDAAFKEARKATAPRNRSVKGQVFVTTRGAGAYKFAGAVVRAFPLSAKDSIAASVNSEIATTRATESSFHRESEEYLRMRFWNNAVANLQAIATATTDAEGNYSLNITSPEPVFIYCATTRSVGPSGEQNVWAVAVAGSDRVDLNSQNQL